VAPRGRPPVYTLHTQRSEEVATLAEVASAGRPNAASTAAEPAVAPDVLAAAEKAVRERTPVFEVGTVGMSAMAEQGWGMATCSDPVGS
jgi:hypothetical protein